MYRFQQLRDQNYDAAICLGISPFDAHCRAISKASLPGEWRLTGNIRTQHGGSGGSDTAWIAVDPAKPPSWLRPHGGSLRSGLARVAAITGYWPDGLLRRTEHPKEAVWSDRSDTV